MKKLLLDDSGQAVVEYLLTLIAIIAIVAIIKRGFGRSLIVLWQTLTREIAAGCPGCPPDRSIKFN